MTIDERLTLRENALEMIAASVTEAATKQHQRNFWKLHVWRDGTVSWFEAVDSSQDLIDRHADHFAPVPSVITVGTNSFSCNCDYCNEVYDSTAEQLALEQGRLYDKSAKFVSFDEAIAESVNSSDLSDLESSMLAAVDDIPVGYFEDETYA